MIKDPVRMHSLVENWAPVEGLLGTYGPEALRATRREALAAFQAIGIPTTKHEEWKYTSLRSLAERDWEVAYGANVYRPDLKGTTLGELEAITLSFVNGQHAPELSTLQVLAGGAVVCTLLEGFETYPDVVSEHLTKYAGVIEGKLGSNLDEPFVHLNTAYLSEGAFVYIPANVAIDEPIHLQFISKAEHGPFVSHPRILIVLGENAQAKIVESYVGLEGSYFTNSVVEVMVAKGAVLEHVKLQQETPEAIHIATTQTQQEGGSHFHAMNVSFGAQISRNDVNLWLSGEYSESRMDGVYVGSHEQIVDNHTRIDHAKPNCNSFEVYKGILSGKATGVFNGKIFVYEDAQKTDAKQTNKALLLSPTATINTKPQLEIFADDVKCTHGATVGQIREEAMFYLRARGIPKKQAESLLVYAFAAEVIERITMPAIAEALEKALFEKLNDEPGVEL